LHWRPWRSTRRHNHLQAVNEGDAVSAADDRAAGLEAPEAGVDPEAPADPAAT